MNLNDFICENRGNSCLSGLAWTFSAQALESVQPAWLERVPGEPSSLFHPLFQCESFEIIIPFKALSSKESKFQDEHYFAGLKHTLLLTVRGFGL